MDIFHTTTAYCSTVRHNAQPNICILVHANTNHDALCHAPMQGLLGGFALLNFFMTYFMYNNNGLKEFLRYYSYLAMLNNRVYYTLITMSLIAATARYVTASPGIWLDVFWWCASCVHG